ncbi:MAG: DNRLRE domain-containing protein [candidate division Zixibacteria bacterium]|nr:DNRLRE domain-containing protein [candidate division Zixibacteria bacterium]
MEVINFKMFRTIILIGILIGIFLVGNVFGYRVLLNPTQDTFIDDIAPGNVNGSLYYMVVRHGGTGYELDALVEFDLSSIPSGATIISATLEMYYWHWYDFDPAGRNLNVHHITSAWDEATTNWDSRPSYNPVPFSFSVVPASTGNWMDFDVTGDVIDILDGTAQNYGWQVMDPALGSPFPMIYYYSKENIDSIPRLILEIEDAPGWYWKPPYANYAPNTPGGMPDFDQKQDAWKGIHPGPDGIMQSDPQGDDVYNADDILIAPGSNCQLDTPLLGDDIIYWPFSGPTAVANCFWWFDSKFADSSGFPGDGEDRFPLVEGYAGYDDHASENVSYLIEDLAGRMGACANGLTDPDDMQDEIDIWFEEKGLTGHFVENTYDTPSFEFIEQEIERSQDVILQLGFWDDIPLLELVDQSQTSWTTMTNLVDLLPGQVQIFEPDTSILDAVEILLAWSYEDVPTPIEVSIYDSFPLSGVPPIGTSINTIWGHWDPPMWHKFRFEPAVNLTPGNHYYIAVRKLSNETLGDPHWCYDEGNPYPDGWTLFNYLGDWILENHLSYDFAFKTIYYHYPEWERKGQHYVTCAGVNSERDLLAISDPIQDIQNPADLDHNNAANVSHDIYPVESLFPVYPSLNKLAGYRHPLMHLWYTTIIEKAIVICPVESPGSYEYIPGDANMYNGIWPPSVIGSDVTYLVNYFRGMSASLPCSLYNPGAQIATVCFWASADANGDCMIIGSDVTKLVSYFRGLTTLSYCSDFPPVWPPLPPVAPAGWPNCLSPCPPPEPDR